MIRPTTFLQRLIARLLVVVLLALDLGGTALAVTDIAGEYTAEWSLSADTDRQSSPLDDQDTMHLDLECCDLEQLLTPQAGARPAAHRAGLDALPYAPQARPTTAPPLLRPPTTSL
jgi:hypothetical protein